MKRPRINRSRADLLAELQEQVDLLAHACQSYDLGLKPIAKHIALSLRVLLHHHGTSQALLQQLGFRSYRFLDTAGDLNPKNLLTENPLCYMRIGRNSDFLPRCVGGLPHEERWIRFEDWWNNPVVRDDKRRVFHRRDLVLNVADTDGGAHVDPALDEAYMDLSRNNSLGWILTEGDVQRPFPSPIMPCIRQIAHELLVTVSKKLADGIKIDYVAQPIIPPDAAR